MADEHIAQFFFNVFLPMSASDGPEESTTVVESNYGSHSSPAEELRNKNVTERMVQLLKGFADGTCLRIRCFLRDREVCVHDVVEAPGMIQSAVRHQPRVFPDARLVFHRREGRDIYYRRANSHVREMLDSALDQGTEPEVG